MPQSSDSFQAQFNDMISRQRRFLQVDNVTVVNATTLAVASFYFGSIALGVLSVLNDAAISVAKHKRARRKKLRAKQDNSLDENTPIAIHDDIANQAELEYAQYEQDVREYKKKYQEYLDQYKVWAEEYGQDPTPHDFPAAVFKRSANDGYDYNGLNIIQWISMLQDLYEKFDYNDLDCQKRLICEVMREPEYYGNMAQKFKSGFQYAKYLEVLSLPDDMRELLDEYLDANSRAEQQKACEEFFQCPYSIKDSVKRNLSDNSL